MRSFPLVVALVLVASSARAADPPVNYSRDVKPILANSCYACHGPDEKQRKAAVRLDLRPDAVEFAIVAGNAAESPLFQRVVSEDPRQTMPPPRSKKPRLTPQQVETVRRWIDQGAKFDQHWAFVQPVRPAVPETQNPKRETRNPVDAFILARLAKEGLKPAPEADRATLLRRLSLDLTGLPPTLAELDAFLADRSVDAYEKQVDRLLASEHFGERMAVWWLDQVRYADTAGYHSDNHRDVAPFRDYVVAAFNANKRFDRFTVEQIAGDLLPKPTLEQRVASGYNRLLMTTEEGGAQAKEYTAKYAADRVRNASSVWLGVTLGCAECHDHKFDPFSTRDFYSFAAFFADVQERAVGRQEQTPLPSPPQAAELKQLDDRLAVVRKELLRPSLTLYAEQLKWEKDAAKAKGLPGPVAKALVIDPAKRNAAQAEIVRTHYRTSVAPSLEKPRKELAAVQAQRDGLTKKVPTSLVSMAGPPRTVRVLPRGNWLDDSGPVVQPAAPASLPPLSAKGRATRMDLARWFVAPDNPLTARVIVNRLWKVAFGQGLVRSLDDFGTQGQPPTHPELLDWLAVEFVERGWDVKGMLKDLVTSHTYRQVSTTSPEVRDRDPSNRLLARQDRFRLDAEFVRDTALALGEILTTKVGGPSVKPYQPAGYWAYLNFPVREWQHDRGPDQYRRGLYTYWCRSFPQPSLLAFDAPSREECCVERPRSSTPLQALALLNDPTYVEASRAFAERILRAGATTEERLGWAFRRATSRVPRPDEVAVLDALYHKHLAEYRSDAEAAKKAIAVGERAVPKGVDTAELAAWSSVARVLLNLHETIARH